LSKIDEVLTRSPLVFQVLRLLQNKGATLRDITRQLRKTKPSTSRAVRTLQEMGLVEATRSQENGRLRIFEVPPSKKDVVQKSLLKLAYGQSSPGRATPFVMADLENLVEEVLRTKLKDWKIDRRKKGYDFVLTHPGRTSIALELKMGGRRFQRRLRDTIGEILEPKEPPQLIVLAVFGRVNKKAVSVIEDRLTNLLKLQGSAIKFLWLDRMPLTTDRTYVDREIAHKILQWTNQS
jgi:DNA-binding MarR family transcriptional regulator